MNVKACLVTVMLAGQATAQGFAGLGTQSDTFAQVQPGTRLNFPQDHGAHPDFRIEWWYLTANLTDTATGAPMGVQWTLFRQAGRPDSDQPGWQNGQVWMGHAAVTTADRHVFAETFARGGVGQGGARAEPFEAWIDDWTMRSTTADGDPFDALALSATGAAFSYDLALQAEGPLVLHGDAGVSRKSEGGQSSFYYSQPFYTVSGQITLDGTARDVTGSAWLDREWSSQPLAPDQSGWDWISLHLASGDRLMAFRLRHTDGRHYTSGTWISPDGTPAQLLPGDVTLTPLERSDVDGRDIPTRWQVTVPSRGLDTGITALNPEAYMTTLFPYWEGPVTIDGGGVGYLEMTGYD